MGKIQKVAGESEEARLPAWQPLTVFCGYRLLLTTLLASIAVLGWGPNFFGRSYPTLFLSTFLIYSGVAIVFSFLAIARRGNFCFQVRLQLAFDIAAITLLLHASGGISSGLGMLLVVVVAAGGILTLGRTASALAAAATLAILLEQSYTFLSGDPSAVSYTQTGLLGATLFATALLAQVLARRVRQSETLAAQRSIDLANLGQLNEYIIQHLQAGILVVDHEGGTVRLMNQAAQNLLDLTQAPIGERLTKIAPSLAMQLVHWRKGAGAYTPEVFDQSKLLPKFIALGKASGTLIFLEDSAVLASRAQQLKLASLGRLTASIAHEIRNPLGAISHAGQLLRESEESSPGERRLLEIMLNHCDRVNSIIENVLQLSRRKHGQREALNLTDWLEHFLEEFCRSQAIDRSQIILGFDFPGIQAYVDPSQFHQIMWNLCANAWRHAQTSGRLPVFQLWVRNKDDAGLVLVEVIDAGPGIPEEVADKIFEPFFTTHGAGTGLGLYIARELAECNEAHLEYRPVSRGGSCFRLCFRSLATEVDAA